jgi:myo-inositol-1(or 4)-monophosphatase
MSYLEICEKAARTGGAVLREKLGKVWIREKKPANLVTEADIASQEIIRSILLDAFPGHCFVGEESGEEYASRGENEFCWIVDPLDGTTNYAHGFPFFAVSIALVHGEKILCGTVYNPALEECFTAEAGKGAFFNGKPIHVRPVTSVNEALVSFSFPALTQQNSPDLLAFLKIVSTAQAIRRTGSTAINLAYIAAGRMDAMVCYEAHAWDVAAGILILREAGGTVSAPDGSEFDMNTPKTLASATETLHRQLLQQLL